MAPHKLAGSLPCFRERICPFSQPSFLLLSLTVLSVLAAALLISISRRTFARLCRNEQDSVNLYGGVSEKGDSAAYPNWHAHLLA